MDTRKLLIALTLASAAGSACAQQIFKYSTAEGTTIYTDQPPVGAQADLLSGNVGPARAEMLAAKQRRISGVAPLPGERNGRHLTPAYWQRQSTLAEGLVLARARVEQALR